MKSRFERNNYFDSTHQGRFEKSISHSSSSFSDVEMSELANKFEDRMNELTAYCNEFVKPFFNISGGDVWFQNLKLSLQTGSKITIDKGDSKWFNRIKKELKEQLPPSKNKGFVLSRMNYQTCSWH